MFMEINRWTVSRAVYSGKGSSAINEIFKIKCDVIENIKIYKALLVLKAFQQVDGVDYREIFTFAPGFFKRKELEVT